MNIVNQITISLQSLSSQQKAQIIKRFFKTGKDQYASGDIFIGVTVTDIRIIARKYYKDINWHEIKELLNSTIHEERSCALLILVEKFHKPQYPQEKAEIFQFYINPINMQWINNWDLVDLSCYKILGEYLCKNQDKINILYDFAKSDNIWIRRIAIVSTMTFIRNNIFEHTIEISTMLLHDKHHLINKAIGWMLREIGKRDKRILLDFLDTNHTKMARISVNYAIEKLSKNEKTKYQLR